MRQYKQLARDTQQALAVLDEESGKLYWNTNNSWHIQNTRNFGRRQQQMSLVD